MNWLSQTKFIIRYMQLSSSLLTELKFVDIPGSGRITFNNQKSFLEAVRSGFVEIETPKFVKKVLSFNEKCYPCELNSQFSGNS